MTWFRRKPEREESVVVELLCMKCRDRFEVTLSTQVPMIAPGLCKVCRQVVEWMTKGDEYLEFLRMETEATRRKWIVR